jgi:hypothetical protein
MTGLVLGFFIALALKETAPIKTSRLTKVNDETVKI